MTNIALTNEKQRLKSSDRIVRFESALAGSLGEQLLENYGVSQESMKQFHLGYDEARSGIIIPYDKQGRYYERYNIFSGTIRMHCGSLDDDVLPFFNGEALYSPSSEVVFVVNDALSAIAILQAGSSAIAVGDSQGINYLYDRVKQKPTKAILALCFNNNVAGRKAAERLETQLRTIDGITSVNVVSAFMGEETDPFKPNCWLNPFDILSRGREGDLKARIYSTKAIIFNGLSDELKAKHG